MRTPLAFVAVTALAATLAGPAGAVPGDTPRAPPLRGHDCLDPGFARGFTTLDHRSLLVDAGRNRYRIEVSPSCWNLDTASVVGFRGDPVSNRVCGSSMDAVLVRGSVPCRIERMTLLSKEQYRQALDEREQWRRQRKAERAAAKKKD